MVIKKRTWIILFSLLFIGIAVLILFLPKSFGKEFSSYDEVDYGYLYATENHLFKEISIPTNNTSEFNVNRVYYDGLRLFLIMDNIKKNDFSADTLKYEIVDLSNVSYEAKPSFIDNSTLMVMVDNLIVNDKKPFFLRIGDGSDQRNSNQFIVQGKKLEKVVPSCRFEELEVDYFLISDTSLYFEGTLSGSININNIQLEHGKDWIKSPLTFEKEETSGEKLRLKALFTINRNNESPTFNLIITGDNDTVTSIIPVTIPITVS